jgi:hypothetical protein
MFGAFLDIIFDIVFLFFLSGLRLTILGKWLLGIPLVLRLSAPMVPIGLRLP